MIFQSFILGNLVSLCMKIINSVVVVGLYYGFLTTFSIGPSYLFLLRAPVMEEGEEGTEKKVSATTGFITGQLMMFISIYYVPLHLALGRPHTITVLALPYLLFNFFWNNRKHFFDYRSTNRNSMRNLSIQCVFLNNLIFQLFNPFILPSSMLVRLVNISLFRCNNKMLFVTSSFVGWLIGHILFMKWVGLILVWIQQNNSIRSNKYLVSELRNFMARIFSILLFITCVYYLGRIPSPILAKKLKETSERGESEEETDPEIETTPETKGTKQEQEGSTEEDPSPSLFSEEKEDLDKIDEREEIRVNGKEKTKDEFLFKETRYKNRPVYETYYLDVDRNQENSKLEIVKEKKYFHNKLLKRLICKIHTLRDKTLVTILFDYTDWNRSLQYRKNNIFENAITLKNEISQYFFHTQQSDGKERISFTHPPSLSTFFEMIERKISRFTMDKLSFAESYNPWNYNKKEKIKNLSNKFINGVKALDKTLSSKFIILDVLEKKKRSCKFCNNTKKKYLTGIYDPLLNGAYREQIFQFFGVSIENKISIQNYIERGCINKIFGLFLIINYLEVQQKKNAFERIESLEKEIRFLLNLMNEFAVKLTSSLNLKKDYLLPEYKQVITEGQTLRFIFEKVQTNPNKKKKIKLFIGIKEIIKKVPRGSYKLIDNLEQEEEQTALFLGTYFPIRSRNYEDIFFFYPLNPLKSGNTSINPQDPNNNDETNNDETDYISLIRYSQQSYFERDIIIASTRAKRRKTVFCKAFEANVHSPTFLDRIDKDHSFSFASYEQKKKKFKNWLCKNTKFKMLAYTDKKEKESTKKKEEEKINEEVRIEVAKSWDYIGSALTVRSIVLVTQSILRKYIILPSLIIVKNIGRILLFQVPEWYEDLRDWWKEMHMICHYNGVPFFEKEFPKNSIDCIQILLDGINTFIEGIQIRILFPFRLKPWHKSKLRKRYNYPLKTKEQKKNFCFLTGWGMETEFPFGSPQKQLSFFEPIFKELKKKLIKLKNKCFLVLIILKERIKFFIFLNVSKETKRGFSKNILFLKKKIKKINQILLFGLTEIGIYELSENKKEKKWIRNKNKIHESSINIQSTNGTTFSLTKKKIQRLTARTNTIINEIQKISNDNKKEFINLHINFSFNKMSYDDKRLESSKTFLQLLKRKNGRLIRKKKKFLKVFVEKVHINIFLYIINFSRINVQLFFFEKTKKILNKYSSYNNYIYNTETNQEKIDKTNKNITKFICSIKGSLYNISNTNLQILCDLAYLSQAYVFYKLSQNTVLNFFNLYKLRLRSVFQSNVTSLFLKNEKKFFFFGTHKLFHSKLRHMNLRHFRKIHQCKSKLKGYYQSQLVPQESRNIVNYHPIVQKKHLNKYYSYEKNRFFNFKKQKNVKKQDRYDLLSYNFIKYEDKKNYFISGLSLQVNKNQYIFYNYDQNKRQFGNMLVGITVNNYLVEDNIIGIKKDQNRKFFDWIFLNFVFRQKINTRPWSNMDTDTTSNKYKTVHQNQEINPSKKKLFDWLRVNEEILNFPILNCELWFFPEFFIISNSDKINPWNIPIELLLLNFNVNEIVKKKRDAFISKFSLEKQNQREKECTVQADFELTLLKEENFICAIAKMKKEKNQYMNNASAEFYLLLKKYLFFQLRCNDLLNQKMINGINIYCFLLKLRKPRKTIITYIRRGQMNLDILMSCKNCPLTQLLKERILLIEPLRLSIKKKGQFIMYQTLTISVVQNNKHTINQRDQEKGHVDKKNPDKLIPRHQKMTENRTKTHSDLFVPESILSPRRSRELRSIISFDSMNRTSMPLNPTFCNANNPFLNKIKRDTNSKLNPFIWPSYRLENFACINRYWFDTNNGSRFGMLRIHMYPTF
uniref:hypothetical protein RF1 n=1 Tax=Pilea dolichocarpa TaxID=345215 RepID=UPI001FCD7EA1|nr:hypothetical protein RF1 [Pilea dolichocarpa]UNY33873.1 hypothetical protein RF1 [Pilea dolichocarpa]